MATGYSSGQLQGTRSNERFKEKRNKEMRIDEKQDWVGSSKQSRSANERSNQIGSPNRFHTPESDDDKTFEASEEMLNSDFKVLLAVSPKPEEAFCPMSTDYQLALHWYNKISTWQCETLEELRLRQVYMSHLSVCFNQKRLSEIFKQIPRDELTWVNFAEGSEPIPCCTSMANTSAWQAMSSMMQVTPDESPGSCCNQTSKNDQIPNMTGGSRNTGGGIKPKLAPRLTYKITYKSRPKLVPRHSAESKDLYCNISSRQCCTGASVPATVCDKTRLKNYQQGINSIGYSSHHRPIDDKTRTDMNYLLETIKNELRGQQNQEMDEYLELELKRYREFYARHMHNDPDFIANAAAGPAKERIYMLLNMQNDLVKLLSD